MSVYAHGPGAISARGVIAREPTGVVARCMLADLGFELGGQGQCLERGVAGGKGAG